ncbi:MAG: 1,4-dihydroxy-2-naphthoate polyprenyltransferase [Nitritalea sp.]
MKTAFTSKKQAWLHALRLRTLPLALSSILLGSIFAHQENQFQGILFLLAALTTIFLQILSNLANDYGDTVHGADSASRKGPVRAVQSGIISLPAMKRAMYLFGALSLLTGLSLIYLALPDLKQLLLFLCLGLLAIYAAITYTSGKNPYGYIGLGDLSVFVFFGLLGVGGTYFLYTGTVNWSILLPATSLGFFSTAVLNINNIRDIESDVQAGKRSIPVRIGRKRAVIYNWVLIVGGNMALLLYVFISEQYMLLAAWGTLPVMVAVGRGVQREQEPELLDPYLKKMALSTLFWVLLLGAGYLVDRMA